MASSVSVSVRMYKVGELGDCFLLRFGSPEEQTCNVLIDCGSFRNSDKSKARMKEIAGNIRDTLSGEPLHVVVGTHQHNDHLSGFLHAEQEFRGMDVKEVWLSWLDDPDNKQAVKIGKEYNNFLTHLRLISAKLRSLRSFNTRRAALEAKQSVDAILGFYGIDDSPHSFGATEKLPPDKPSEAVKILKTLGSRKTKYLSPGQVFNLKDLPDGSVKVYVLGPPRDEKLLKDPNPNSKETYDHGLAATNNQAAKMLLALNTLSPGSRSSGDDQSYPFNEPDTPRKDWGIFDAVEKSYNAPRNNWRRIDSDWLKQAERLALWLHSYTNNSSLVLAFELVKADKVLLFVGDAQTGNWNSWKTIEWKKMPTGFDWKSLLQKTVLYKVGHHCSHNATLVEGLEAMDHEELVAMIPVDESDGNIKKENGWKMPAVNLLERLKEKTKGRIIRMDNGFTKAKGWDKVPCQPKREDLYWEYEIKG